MPWTPVLQIYTTDPEIPGTNAIGYILTDHNRQALQFSYEAIEDSNRMADGTLRKYIAANKKKISTSWQTVPVASGRLFTADANLGAGFIKSFYEENVYKPVWVKMVYAAENWRFANTLPDTSPSATTNSTFLTTGLIGPSVSYPYVISSASIGNFTSGSSTASIVTAAPHNLTTTNSPYVFINGIDQIYNGAWKITSAANNLITFVIGANNNASADFNLNGYLQSGSTTTFAVDSNDFIQNGMNIVVTNTKAYNGTASSINGTWTVNAKNGNTQFIATNSAFSGSSVGYIGTGIIFSGNGSGKSIATLAPGIIGPAVGADIIKAFMTNFTYNITNRFVLTDYADVSIEFTEI
jgi:hypothetical protein